jgi:aspartyl-tRNA(Asn)/glutamyl-tRNA(Gln) amidotransferase subunit A
MSMSLLSLTLSQAKKALEKKEISSVALTQYYIQRMESLNPKYNAYITQTAEHALEMAKSSDARRAQGRAGVLEGIPLAIKDVFCTKGVRTTFASKITENFVPQYESTVTERLAQEGAVFLGKANLDEFCMGSMNTYSMAGRVSNPWNTECVSGGSSGGSVAAVSGGLALGAIGSDTGGSIRQPAAFCGVVGVKPTYGRVSRYGMAAFSSSLDQAGPIGRTVEDAAHILHAMWGYDEKDSTSSTQASPDLLSVMGTSLKGKVVGIPKEFYEQSYREDVRASWDQSRHILEDAGCIIQMVSLAHAALSLPSYYLIVCAEAASNLARYDGVKYGKRSLNADTLEEMYCNTRGEGFGAEVKRRILIGTYVLSRGYYDAYYGKALSIRRVIQEEFSQIFQKVNVLLMPTTPTPAFSVEEAPSDLVTIYLNDVLTVPANIGNVCGISVPCGLSTEGLPLGMQVIAPAFEEARLFQYGNVLEQAYQFSLLPCLT